MFSANRPAAAILSVLLALAGLTSPGAAQSRPARTNGTPAVIVMDEERVKLAEIELRQAGPAARLTSR